MARRSGIVIGGVLLLLGFLAGLLAHDKPGPGASPAPQANEPRSDAPPSDGKLRIIAFGAHPDDCEIKVGGTAAKWAAQGHHVLFVSVTNGDIGHWRMAGGPLAQRRSREVAQAAKILGIHSRVLDIHDGELEPTLEHRRTITRLIREWHADLVLSHRPNDYHPDHRYTGILVQDAAYMVTVPFFCPDVPFLTKNPVFLYYSDRFERPNPFRPDVVVAIDDVMEKKLSALDAIESQFFEGGANGSAALIPKDEAGRQQRGRQVREGFMARDAAVADKYRAKLIESYGQEQGAKVRRAEAFEVCEYGSRPDAAEIRRLFPFFGGASAAPKNEGAAVPPDDQDLLKVGVQPDGRIVVPTNQVLSPAGKQITFPGRPVDLALADDGRTVVAKSQRSLVFIDTAAGTVKQTLSLPQQGKPKPGFGVVGLLVQGDKIYASDAHSRVRVAQRGADGAYQWALAIELPKAAVEIPTPAAELDHAKAGEWPHPAGIAASAPGRFWVTSTRGNNVHLVDPATGKTEQTVSVGVAPYTLCFLDADHFYVSNWGGDRPSPGTSQGNSSGTRIRTDPRTGVANHGTVSRVSRHGGQWKQDKSIPVGLHPCGLALSPNRRFLYVANANSDTVSVIDTRSNAVVETIPCRPAARLPFGSGANALAVSPDGGTLYVANGTNNCVAVIRLSAQSSDGSAVTRLRASTVAGLVPTGWYPGALLLSPDGRKLFVANVKGHGSLSQPRPKAKGMNSHDHLGSVSVIDLPDAAQLERYTEQVNANNRLAYSLAGLEKPRHGTHPAPVPMRHGEPSLFKHVVYIIKENRTYDQVFGDIKEGNGDPNLCLFGDDVTPNHHALARQFTLFDNFYCSGVLSADGHTWINEAYVTDYLEKSFGGFTRSYPDDGSDPLAYAPTGFLWDNALAHGKTIRNYGEYVKNEYIPSSATWTDLYNDYRNGTQKVKVTARANLKSLEPFTHPGFPWFPLHMPDIYRARLFIDELKAFEQKGELPNLIYLTLPCDHTEGTKPDFPTPQAMVADNDLALGQVVAAITKSKFWPQTCIFVVEDDPQDGFDHVDAHRTVALVISPYTRRGFVDHTNYNQTGMVKTIELILGLPPMNQLDLSATPMRHCFQPAANLAPYTCRLNKLPLDQMNRPLKLLNGQALHWARKSLALNLDEGDKADEDTLNRILWHAVRGYNTPYPERFAGKNREADETDDD